jgi:hypothetical protein
MGASGLTLIFADIRFAVGCQIAAVLLCTILPSTVAFTSLISISGVPTIAACEFADLSSVAGYGYCLTDKLHLLADALIPVLRSVVSKWKTKRTR